MAKEVSQIPKKSDDLSAWYLAVVQNAKLADYGPVRGTIIFRPNGYALWEKAQKYLDDSIKHDVGAENVYFPLFIPESYLKKEKKHVEGFSPELAVVTIGGGEKLAEPLVVRPTSETIINDAFSRWISSYRDLPMKINQWANVVRWELRSFPFLRNTEFLWQEGHTVHATHEDAQKTVKEALNAYIALYQEKFAVYGIAGRKSESEKFAGADVTFTYEMLMPDGKALQGCTSHDLGQNFAKAFNVKFQDEEGKEEFGWQTSWGLTTRSIGALVMVQGDDRGLVIPPAMARYSVVIVPVLNGKEDAKVLEYAEKVQKLLRLNNDEVYVDTDKEHSLGFRLSEWDIQGAPIRIEIGMREVENEQVTIFRRDTLEKETVSVSKVSETVEKTSTAMQKALFESSKKFTHDNTHSVDSYDEFKNIMNTKRGFLMAFWCENENCEKKIKEETKATTRCLPFDSKKESGKCIYCGKEAAYRWLFAQAY
jgi:prolyl-tRNA synthetase